jgi:general secretion pathway protein G
MDLSSLELALDAFQIDTKHYPAQTEGLQALVQEPANATGWRGPYMRIIPPDPRGKPYIYVFPGTHLQDGFDLSSAGPDGKPGTADDITNW